MTEIQIGVLSPLPPRAGCRHMGCENRLVPPCILLHTDRHMADMHKTWASIQHQGAS